MQTTNNESKISKIIDWSIKNQLLVIISVIFLIVFGWISLKKTPLDAIPDLSDTQVIIKTNFPGQSPQIIEDVITYPISTTMLGLPKTKDVRGFSMFGSSFVYVIFEDGVDQYWARNRVIEAISKIESQLPKNSSLEIGPDATGVGWVYQYALVDKSGKYDLAYLRTLQDWFLKFELATVNGVSEVASIGGFEKEYQVLIDPNRLRAYNISIKKVIGAIQSSSKEVGGRVIEQGEMEFIIRSKGYIKGKDDLKNIILNSKDGTAILLTDIARIVEGPKLRRGVAELNGEGETVAGIIVARSGENALSVIKRVKEKINDLKKGLPDGVEIVEVYNRAPLIQNAVDNLTTKLIEEAIAVALVSIIFLLHARSALVAIITIPLGILASFIVMSYQGINANIMSLGGIAIAIGAMVDASIVMIENSHRKLSQMGSDATIEEKKDAIIQSVKEVGPGLFFSLLIITVSFIPVFFLTGQSYKLFAPLAFTKTYSMAFSAILSITVIPVLMLWLIKGKIKKEEDNPINRWFIKIYRPILTAALKNKKITIFASVLILFSAIIPITKTGSEFMPSLYEGELLYMPTSLPGISLTKSKEILAQTNRLIKNQPEVKSVFGKLGRATSATDASPISMIETWVQLKPKEEWRDGYKVQDIINELDKLVKIPGIINSWGYPIKTRMDMITTGIRTPIGIKVSGSDLEKINQIALSIESLLKDVDGTRSIYSDRVLGGKYIEITPNREKLARHNISIGTFQTVVQTTLGGIKITETIQNRERYNVVLRYQRKYRESIHDLQNILVPSDNNVHIPLGEVATIKFTEGPPVIKSENARLSGWVNVDIKDIDIVSYVNMGKKIINEKIDIPAGYSIEWSGEFQQLEEAKTTLNIAIVLSIIIILVLLLIHFERIDRTLIVMLSLPFGLIGGVWFIYLFGYNFSIAVVVGFIALGGIAAETTIMMLLYIDKKVSEEKQKNLNQLFESIIYGAVLRIRPKLMTVLTIFVGLIPIFLTDGIGSDVMRRIALPMLGGMVSTTILTLIVIPVIYYIWEGRKLAKK